MAIPGQLILPHKAKPSRHWYVEHTPCFHVGHFAQLAKLMVLHAQVAKMCCILHCSHGNVLSRPHLNEAKRASP